MGAGARVGVGVSREGAAEGSGSVGAGAGLVPARVLAVADRSTAHATRPQKVVWARGRPAGSWVTRAAPEPPITTSAIAAHTNGFRACLASQGYPRPRHRGSPWGGSAESLAGAVGIWSPSMKPPNPIKFDDHYLDGIRGRMMTARVPLWRSASAMTARVR